MKLFLNYRTQEAKEIVHTIANFLFAKYGEQNVFFDRQKIEAGKNFKKTIKAALDECALFLPVIGKDWMSILAQRKVFDEPDYVVEEIKSALENKVIIMPILIDDAIMPSTSQLPKEIEELPTYQAAHISTQHHRTQDDLEILKAKIDKILKDIKVARPNRIRNVIRSILMIGFVALIAVWGITKFTRLGDAPEDPSGADTTVAGGASLQKAPDFEFIETDYFLNREVFVSGVRLRYENFLGLTLKSIRDDGATITGPACTRQYDNYLIRYEIKGKSKDGRILDYNLDYKVNSNTNLFKPVSEAAIHFNNLVDPEYRESSAAISNSNNANIDASLEPKVELDFFLNREVEIKAKRLRYEQVVEMFLKGIKDNGLNVEGPVCTPRYNNFLIRYSVTGTSKNGKIWDTKIDFEVNSRNGYFKASSKLAKAINDLVDERYR